MSTLDRSTNIRTREAERQRIAVAAPDSRHFDLLVAGLSIWVLIGLYIDGWAHNSIPDLIETFFTPWHAVLYSGVAAVGACLLTKLAINASRGYPLKKALPRGYRLALLGMGIFALSGGGDFIWHELFGFEVDVEALLSPSHLALATGAVLFLSAPFRAAWQRTDPEDGEGWRALLPAVVALFIVFSVFTFMTQFSNPFSNPQLYTGFRPTANVYYSDVAGISYILTSAALMMFFLLLAVRRWQLPFGSLTLILFGNAAMMLTMAIERVGDHWPVAAAALIGGFLADTLLLLLRPSVVRVRALRLFAFATPFLFYLTYFLVLMAIDRVWWSIHMWLGATVLAGIIGLGLSYLLAPPAIPAESANQAPFG